MGRITVDKNKCIGCGMCMTIAPEVFELGDEGKAKVKVSEFKGLPAGRQGSKVQKIQEAVDSCPVTAIQSSD